MTNSSAEGERPTLALYWRCDGSDGIVWRLRSIDADGAFYGEIRRDSEDEVLCRFATVSGRLSHAESERMAELVAVIRQPSPPDHPGPHFAALFERSWRTFADARHLYVYHLGDEARSEAARAFVELAGIVERHLSPEYAKIAVPDVTPDAQ
ncbi:hypothetical protein [Limnoglobus roseus]|uniref:Uncharacterized protein n=1 Tax=Limnoglobus roseus TaxID=2598579 RepID=A0A5C1AEE2_9BACT|nr:hypothetical protein [Limnoglobus roseus]QEL16406.1 hypothetical protein PX52LOC_03359 [Limnoglobus roseus]